MKIVEWESKILSGTIFRNTCAWITNCKAMLRVASNDHFQCICRAQFASDRLMLSEISVCIIRQSPINIINYRSTLIACSPIIIGARTTDQDWLRVCDQRSMSWLIENFDQYSRRQRRMLRLVPKKNLTFIRECKTVHRIQPTSKNPIWMVTIKLHSILKRTQFIHQSIS